MDEPRRPASSASRAAARSCGRRSTPASGASTSPSWRTPTAAPSTAPTRDRSPPARSRAGARSATTSVPARRVPGFEHAYLLEIAPQVGIRETRRLVGDYVLTADDVLGCADFDDTIGVNGWPLELHVAGDVEWRWPPIPDSRGFNQLPYACCCRSAVRQPARRRALRVDDARRPVGGARLRRLLRHGPGGRYRCGARAGWRGRPGALPVRRCSAPSSRRRVPRRRAPEGEDVNGLRTIAAVLGFALCGADRSAGHVARQRLSTLSCRSRRAVRPTSSRVC